MPDKELMNLKILLPFCIFADETRLNSIVAETSAGSTGILPHRRDCVTALSPGILIYKTSAGHEVFVAVDGGILIKCGFDVLVSVRNAVKGLDLAELQEIVEHDFMVIDQSEQNIRLVMSKMESTFLLSLGTFSHG